MRKIEKNTIAARRIKFLWCALVIAFFSFACKKSENPGDFDVPGSDETVKAGELIADANRDLTKIKVLYKDNEDKREQIKKALDAKDEATVKKTSDDVVYLINDGMSDGNDAVEKIKQAQAMNISDDYREYLELKQKSLEKELEAFENYRQAARSLRDNYDPKNVQMRDKVREEFKTRSENYRNIMETARNLSNQANLLAKSAARKTTQ